MKRKLLSLVLALNFYTFFSSAYAHVLHYDNLNKLIFEIYRNNQFIGEHIYLFNRDGNKLIVKSTLNFEIKKLGITIYKYFSEGIEKYTDGQIDSFSSKTKQNKKERFVNIFKKDNKIFIEGSSYKGEAPKDFVVGTWWNHSLIKSKVQISAISGRIIDQKVKLIAKENLEINGKKFSALRFNFSSSDPTLPENKKLNTDIWYDEKTLLWLKAGFKKKGDWEYRLVTIE